MNVVENTLRMPKPEVTFECRIFNTVYKECDADANRFEPGRREKVQGDFLHTTKQIVLERI